MAQNWDDLIANGLASEDNKAAALELLTVTNDPAALAGCTYVFEAVAEGNMNNVPLAFYALAGVARRVMV